MIRKFRRGPLLVDWLEEVVLLAVVFGLVAAVVAAVCWILFWLLR